MGRPRRVVDAEKVTELRALGYSWPEIPREFGIGVGTAARPAWRLSKPIPMRSLKPHNTWEVIWRDSFFPPHFQKEILFAHRDSLALVG